MTDPASLRLVLLAVGRKGLVVLERVVASCRPLAVHTYPQDDDRDGSHARIVSLCEEAGIAVHADRRPDLRTHGPLDLVLVVGWQYLLDVDGLPVAVLHDSLLPRLRGFAPTVTALLLGHDEIGVSAIRPVAAVDAGPVLGQRSWRADHPITIAEALERQAHHEAELAAWLLGEVASSGLPAGTPQDEQMATYALWRDEDDGWIDWRRPAGEIRRFVDAIGHPYAGARTRDDEDVVVVHAVEEVADVAFEHRIPGKVWAVAGGRATVVCGQGMLRLVEARRPDGSPVEFRRLRVRLRPTDGRLP